MTKPPNVVNRSRAIASVLLFTAALFARQAGGAVSIDTVTVGNPGNAPDTRYVTPGYGAVRYAYQMGKYEVTAGQYTAFLNAVARVDAYGLYNTSMWTHTYGCKINRSGGGTQSDPYVYGVAADAANRPVNWVSWGDAARFTNWLTNGQPTGVQDLSTTEDGSYCLNGATTDAALLAVTRKPGAAWVIPTEDEWYKAAYYDPAKTGGAGYWDYATRSNAVPGRDPTEATNPGNNANSRGGPYPIDPPYYTTVVGQFYLSRSPYGTLDQSGNVWEWNEAVRPYSARDTRGGSFDLYNDYMLAREDRPRYPSYEYAVYGFRVAVVPEPCSLRLFLLVGMGSRIRRKV